jgi:hypothetical protein
MRGRRLYVWVAVLLVCLRARRAAVGARAGWLTRRGPWSFVRALESVQRHASMMIMATKKNRQPQAALCAQSHGD